MSKVSPRLVGRLISVIRSQEEMSVAEIAEAIGVNQATVKRNVSTLRREFGAPIVTLCRGYAWQPDARRARHAEALVEVFCRRPS